jgi:2-methylaconitate cis-trans-isomerase PrpF
VPRNGTCTVRIWQANIGKTIVAHVPIVGGEVQETGDFELDGVTFPAAEVPLEFIDPADEGNEWRRRRRRDVPDRQGRRRARGARRGHAQATLINAGIPTIFVDAAAIGYTGTELQDAINGDPAALAMFETIRAHGAVKMGLIKDIAEAARRQHTPKVAFVAPPGLHRLQRQGREGGGRRPAGARAVDGQAAPRHDGHGGRRHRHGRRRSRHAGEPRGRRRRAQAVRFGHPSGTLRVGAEATRPMANGW